ncbi:MAG: hypothetical protein ACKOU7_09145 [Ferruginibacter sp.]
MKKIIPLILFVFISASLPAQDFTGQWKGEFIDKSTSFTGWGGDRCEYVLELECNGTRVSGYSYTYFSDGGKRYYTICKLSGTIDKASKSVEVREIERTKTNVPVTIRNCFQIHRLTYFKKDDEQSLEGSWVPVPNQQGDCGFGTTVLSRRVLQKNPAYFNNPVTKSEPVVKPKTTKPSAPVVKTVPRKIPPPVVVKKEPATVTTNAAPKKTTVPPVVKVQPKKTTAPVAKKEAKQTTETPVTARTEPGKKANTEQAEPVTNNLPTPEPAVRPDQNKVLDDAYKKRNSELIKTIEIDSTSFTVALYDNGEIDGDSISLFFNGKLLLSHKRLTEKPLRLTLDVDPSKSVNELVMYAENLGTIPPNTALMVVNDGDNRYEVRISSDLQKSGTIRFIHKSKTKQ